MRKIIIYLAHPRLDRSEIHVKLKHRLEQHPAVMMVDLYAEYPDFNIDVIKEKERLTSHDAVIFQHPVFWYSSPAILKEWQDLVLEHGFAYGENGDQLKGKAFGQIVSTGAPETDYAHRGVNKHTLEEMFTPFEATARMCQMIYLPPLALYSAETVQEEDRLAGFADACIAYLDALADTTNAIEDLGKRGDIISTLRKFMRV